MVKPHSLLLFNRVADYLDQVTAINSDVPCADKVKEQVLKVFECPVTLDASVSALMLRLRPAMRHNEQLWVVALIYVHRLLRQVGLPLELRHAHCLILTAALLAAKKEYGNGVQETFRSLTGVSSQQMALMERAFLVLTSWQLHVFPPEYMSVVASLPALQAYVRTARAPVEVLPSDVLYTPSPPKVEAGRTLQLRRAAASSPAGSPTAAHRKMQCGFSQNSIWTDELFA